MGRDEQKDREKEQRWIRKECTEGRTDANPIDGMMEKERRRRSHSGREKSKVGARDGRRMRRNKS